MRKTHAQNFLGKGATLPPSQDSRASLGDMEKTRTTASVPIENCLIRGVQSNELCPFLCPVSSKTGSLIRALTARISGHIVLLNEAD